MIKVFTTNKNGKIELTKEELEKILNDSYWEGYSAATNNTYIYKSPSIITTPYYTVTTCSANE